MNKCTFCGDTHESCRTRVVRGYTILEHCTGCEREILVDVQPTGKTFKIQISPEMRSILIAIRDAAKKDARRPRFGFKPFRAKLPPNATHYLVLNIEHREWYKVYGTGEARTYQYRHGDTVQHQFRVVSL